MYYLLIFVVLLMYYHLETCPAGMRKKLDNKYAIVICVILILLAAFRSNAVGADTAGYRADYENLRMYHSLKDLIERYSLYYMGYFVPSKLFHVIGMPVQVWFGAVMAFYLYAMMRLINKFSLDKVFSLLIFITIGLWSFSMAGLKQTVAMSMMMLAFVCFIEKKYWKTLLLVVLVYFTHQAALIGLGAIPLYYIRNSKWYIPITIIACVLIYAYSYFFMETMVNILGNEKWQDYLRTDSAYSYVTFIFYTVITAFAYFNFRNYKKADSEYANYFLGLSTIGCGLQLFAGVSASLFRLAFLYTPFLMVLLPNSIYYCSQPQKKLMKLIVMGCIIFYFLYVTRRGTYSFI